MGHITINGTTYTGNNISVIDNQVIIDGVLQDSEPLKGIVKLVVNGDIRSLNSDRDLEIHGNVLGDASAVGSITCRDVTGHIEAGGSVNCGNVGGGVAAGGTVNCRNVTGDVDAGGSVTHC